ncbi:MAG: SPOR domain-containing protein, partial [Rhodospirillales bacterium]|nr:SPOR domain-containing protein [Rhodospirillales bacterium]
PSQPSFGTPPPPPAALRLPAFRPQATMQSRAPMQPLATFDEGDKNRVARFQTLASLRDQGLITPAEFAQRRALNRGALLPLTTPSPSTGLDRSVPGATQIAQRLRAIRRALEMRAITVRQHGAERTMIVDGLMPSEIRARDNPALPPKGLMEAASAVRRIEALRELGLITSDEYTKERAAIENTLRPPPPPAAERGSSKPQAGVSSGPMPALHIASYRSEQSANKGWTQLRRAHKSVVGNLRPEVARVNLGRGKGVFYRLIVGPFKIQDEAKSACRQLKRRRQYCEPAFMSGAG